MSVPKFGAWEAKPGSSPSNYTVMFSEARANRKQHKTEYTHHSIGNDQELRGKQYGAPMPMEEDYGRGFTFKALETPSNITPCIFFTHALSVFQQK
nr:putative RIN4, pathogenic type III effector avirulence factor Avr cleavage [Ipomoea batatas]